MSNTTDTTTTTETMKVSRSQYDTLNATVSYSWVEDRQSRYSASVTHYLGEWATIKAERPVNREMARELAAMLLEFADRD